VYFSYGCRDSWFPKNWKVCSKSDEFSGFWLFSGKISILLAHETEEMNAFWLTHLGILLEMAKDESFTAIEAVHEPSIFSGKKKNPENLVMWRKIQTKRDYWPEKRSTQKTVEYAEERFALLDSGFCSSAPIFHLPFITTASKAQQLAMPWHVEHYNWTNQILIKNSSFFCFFSFSTDGSKISYILFFKSLYTSKGMRGSILTSEFVEEH
jgi:hypothetical protein